MKLIEEVGYDALYIFKYSERRGTPAAKLPDDVSREEKSARFIELETTQHRLQDEIYQGYVGRTLNVLVERMSSKSDQRHDRTFDLSQGGQFPGGDQTMLGQVVDGPHLCGQTE